MAARIGLLDKLEKIPPGILMTGRGVADQYAVSYSHASQCLLQLYLCNFFERTRDPRGRWLYENRQDQIF